MENTQKDAVPAGPSMWLAAESFADRDLLGVNLDLFLQMKEQNVDVLNLLYYNVVGVHDR